jgi:excisionase family DNA binding protein
VVLKIAEVAALLRVDQKTVRDIIARGELRAMRVGRRGLVRVVRAVLEVRLGHSSIVTTQRYVHLAPGGGRELIGALDTPAARANQVQTDPVTKHQTSKT